MKLKLLTCAILMGLSSHSFASESEIIEAQTEASTILESKAFKIADNSVKTLNNYKEDEIEDINYYDPLEGMNRKIYSFNTVVDNAVLKPVAKGYQTVVPNLFRMIIGNMISNVGDAVVVVNDLLQFRPVQAFKDASRLVINTTFGFLGMADMATAMNLPKNPTNFGETLNRWGIGSGAYVVLPVLGPSTVGDTIGLVVDSNVDPFKNIDHIPTRNSVVFVKTVDKRANLLNATEILDQSALDPYSAVRDAYYQKKQQRLKAYKQSLEAK